MTHPGLPDIWAYGVWIFMILLSLWSIFSKIYSRAPSALTSSTRATFLQQYTKIFTHFIFQSAWTLRLLKLTSVALFLLVIIAGLYGSQIPERNIATVLTWNIWWAGLIISVFFVGSSWCAICPWDTLASWLVKPRLWINQHFLFKINNSLELKPPQMLRNVWPALLMFIGLTWLELGVGITTNPYATALLSLLMIVMATLSLAIFKNKAFCHYFCPVGRTIGFYSQLAPIEPRPINTDICKDCSSLACFNGTENIEACPTQLVMGSLKQNTYCTSCGNCVKSCPDQNISWRFRPQSQEAIESARPHWDEAWFMLILLALTSFHGISMMPFWETWVVQVSRFIVFSNPTLISFSIGLIISLIIPILGYVAAVVFTRKLTRTKIPFKKVFNHLIFISLPLAFSYHLAHNLNHIVRESAGVSELLFNPLGINSLPLSASESMMKAHEMLISQDSLFVVQSLLMAFGFFVSIKILRHRTHSLFQLCGYKYLPMLVFIFTIHSFNLWMLMQPMVMRLGTQ